MRDLWRPIEDISLEERYSTDILLCAPELVDADCNPLGLAPGFWEDSDEVWIGAGYCMQHDHFKNTRCNPTHFLIMEGPYG